MTPDRLPADVIAHVEEVSEAAQVADGAAPLDEATGLALRHRPAADIGWWRADAGFALLIEGELSLVVHPDARGDGVGTTLLGEVTEVTTGEELTAWSHGNHPAAAALADRFGFARDRDLWVMRRPVTGEDARPLPALVVPSEVTVRGFRGEDSDDLLRVNAAAFSAHPEQGSLDADGLAVRQHEPWFDPEGLLVARDADGTMLGFHWTKVHPAETDGAADGPGEVYVVGVAPEAQGRGMGRVLTLAGLHHLAGRGVAEVLLYVEADNAPAINVYEGLGFRHDDVDTHVQYRRPASEA